MSVSESIGPLVYPHRDCAKAKHRSPSEGAKPTGHSFKPMIACCRGWPRLSYWAWVVGPACGSVPIPWAVLIVLPVPSLGGLPVGGKHSAASQNCLAYGKGRVRSKCQHLPPCRGWASVAAVASAAGLASPQLLVRAGWASAAGVPCCCPALLPLLVGCCALKPWASEALPMPSLGGLPVGCP